MCGRLLSTASGSAASTPGAACPGRRSGCAMVSASVCTSSGVTPRSNAMRSMPRLFSRRIISPIDSAARGSGTSPTMISWPMMPIGDRRLVGQQLRERFVEAVERALHQRMRRRVELRGAQRRGEPAHEVVCGAQARDLDPLFSSSAAAAPVRPAPPWRSCAPRPARSWRLPRARDRRPACPCCAARAPRRCGCARCGRAPTIRRDTGCPSAPTPSARRAPPCRAIRWSACRAPSLAPL